MQGYCWVVDSIVTIVSIIFTFFKSVAHGHRRGKRLGTSCCALAKRCGTPKIGPKWETPKAPKWKDYKMDRANNNIQESNLFNPYRSQHPRPCQTIGRSTWRDTKHNTCLLLEPHVSGVMSLQHVSMFQYASCAWAWMRQVPWYMPWASARWVGCREFAACVNVSLCWLCMGMDEARLGTRDVSSSQNAPTATERQQNGFSMGTRWKAVECWRGTRCWPVFLAVAGRCWLLLAQRPLLKMQRVLNLRLNLLNCNGFSTGYPL